MSLVRADEYVGPHPVIHPENEEFWTSIGRGELRLQHCGSCGQVRFPIAPVCYKCGSFDYSWEVVSAAGTVAVAVRVDRATGDQVWATQVPFISGLVDIAQELRLPGRIFCKCGKALEHGTPVTGAYQPGDGFGVLCFTHGCAA